MSPTDTQDARGDSQNRPEQKAHQAGQPALADQYNRGGFQPSGQALPSQGQTAESRHLAALLEVGMFKPYDAVLAVVLLLAFAAALVWCLLFGAGLYKLLLAFFVIQTVLSFWLVCLVFRCTWFVIKTWADVNLTVNGYQAEKS